MELRNPNVEELDPLAGRQARVGNQHYVSRLWISVHDPCGVGSRQSRRQISDNPKSLQTRTSGRQTGREGLAPQELHHHSWCSVGKLTEVDDFDDTRMVNLADCPRLIDEALEESRMCFEIDGPRFEGGALTDVDVGDFKDQAHTTFTDLPDNPVVVDDLTNRGGDGGQCRAPLKKSRHRNTAWAQAGGD